MINQSHAARFTDDRITQHLDAILRAAGPSMRPYTLLKYREDMRPAVRAIEVAMLVKLHAPVFDERVAFKRGERTYLLERNKEDDYVAPCVEASWGDWQGRAMLACPALSAGEAQCSAPAMTDPRAGRPPSIARKLKMTHKRIRSDLYAS